jgi:hypothetical protein
MDPIAPLMHRRLPRLLAVMGVLAICLGATSRSCSLATSGANGNDPSFVAHLELRDINGDTTDSFQRGELINLVLTVRNRLDSKATAEFTTARESDFVVVRENTNDVVWKWSHDRTFPQVATTLEFAPSETKSFSVTWNQTDSNGNALQAGTYEARGALVYAGFDTSPLQANQFGSTLERFTIN